MDMIQSWPIMKQVMQEEYLPNDYFEDFCYVEDTFEDISYEVEFVEVIKDEPLILEVEDYNPTIDIDCTLDVAEAKLEAKSISIDKVFKGDNLFENPHNFNWGSISGFPWVNLPNLWYLDLSSNKLGGNFHDSLGYLGNLEFILLSDNSIVGSLPTFIGNLSLLGVLELSLNMINRIIPESLGKPANLIAISLKNNAISGPIPLNFGHEITEMVWLDLS
ncbi:hypothetical protein Ddye_031550 [Dipteronia dyeriana]|uniref:Leucine-rich repeat protein n=1 Tax=Dipteronia dyeriana TaxID=168575 RepID=A0AAD9TJI5_9ROSI|nr:hypothetical protein Ddye_031550 [Dipteronia dyeriana]